MKKWVIIPSFNRKIDILETMIMRKILEFNQNIDYSKFDFWFGIL